MKTVKLAGEEGSADQDAVGEVLPCVMQEKGYMDKQVFNTGKTDCFYKVIGK